MDSKKHRMLKETLNQPRREFLKGLLFFLKGGFLCSILSPFFLLPSAYGGPAQNKDFHDKSRIDGGIDIGKRFLNEELRYSLELFGINVAAGVASFKNSQEEGRYIATFAGKAKGVFGLFTLFRQDRYSSLMEASKGKDRFLSLKFEEDVIIGSKKRSLTIDFDHKNRLIVETKKRGGKIKKKEQRFPEGYAFEDMITIFYNFRYGNYGKIERGATFNIPTIPKKDSKFVRIEVANQIEEERERAKLKDKKNKDLFVKVSFPHEMIEHSGGSVDGWFNRELVPVEGAARKFFFGEVKGYLIEPGKIKGKGV